MLAQAACKYQAINKATPRREQALVERARREGVGLQPASPCYASAPPPGRFLFWFSHLEEAALTAGVRRLDSLL